MTDQEIRVACVQAASVTPGNPNHVQMAREYYEFVMEGAASLGVQAGTEPSEAPTTTKKTARK